MSKLGIDDYLLELSRYLRVGPYRRTRILKEVKDHLLRTVEEQTGQGIDPQRAEDFAISQFGEPALTARRISPTGASNQSNYSLAEAMTPKARLSRNGVTKRMQSKKVSLLYAGIAFLVLTVVAAMALVFVPPSPPTVAEFQPQALEQIEEAPLQQSSQFGSGAGGACVLGQVCEETELRATAPNQVIERARVRRCVGDPPRQTEDPQSPPCINFWKGDNGGATSKGVTRDEIRVAANLNVYRGGGGPHYLNALVRHFNARYEFYGRKIRLVDLTNNNNGDPAGQRAAAQKAAIELDAFAALPVQNTYSESSYAPYRTELARSGVISVFGHQLLAPTENLLRQLSPHAWDYYPPLEEEEANLAEFACKVLVDRPAEYAGPGIQQKERRFAAVFTDSAIRETPPTEPLRSGLAACDTSLLVSSASDNTGTLATMADLNARGITTIVVLDDGVTASNSWLQKASSQNYFPEWVLVGNVQANEQQWSHVASPDQRAHMFGIVAWNKFHLYKDEPAWWAVNEGDPSVDASAAMTPRTRDDYHALLVLASGIQMAGPRLTPKSFAAALERTQFSNPRSGAAPYFQAAVEFSPTSHSMISDFAVVWWSDRAPTYHGCCARGQTELTGGFCWLYRGARWSRGQWPPDIVRMFDLDPRTCR